MKKTDPQAPAERTVTVRAALRRALSEGAATAKDLSAQVGIREKDVAEHLQHLERSLRAEGLALHVHPATCLACSFVFEDRRRLTRPGACPKCRETRIDPPMFEVRAGR